MVMSANYPQPSPNKRQFYHFLICMPLFSFSCLNALERTSVTMLNGNDESRHNCLFPCLGEKVFHYSSLSMMLIRDFFVEVFYQVEEIPLFQGFWEFLISDRYRILSDVFSVSLEGIIWFVFLSLLI